MLNWALYELMEDDGLMGKVGPVLHRMWRMHVLNDSAFEDLKNSTTQNRMRALDLFNGRTAPSVA